MRSFVLRRDLPPRQARRRVAALLGLALALVVASTPSALAQQYPPDLVEQRSQHRISSRAFRQLVGSRSLALGVDGSVYDPGDQLVDRRAGQPVLLQMCCIESGRIARFYLRDSAGPRFFRAPDVRAPSADEVLVDFGVAMADDNGVAVIDSDIPEDIAPGWYELVALSSGESGLTELAVDFEVVGDDEGTGNRVLPMVAVGGIGLLALLAVWFLRRNRDDDQIVIVD